MALLLTRRAHASKKSIFLGSWDTHAPWSSSKSELSRHTVLPAEALGEVHPSFLVAEALFSGLESLQHTAAIQIWLASLPSHTTCPSQPANESTTPSIFLHLLFAFPVPLLCPGGSSRESSSPEHAVWSPFLSKSTNFRWVTDKH